MQVRRLPVENQQAVPRLRQNVYAVRSDFYVFLLYAATFPVLRLCIPEN